MARHKFEKVFQDGSGNGVASGTISVYLAGTTTAASVYEAESGGSPVSSVTSGSDGVFYFWVDDATYTHSQLFKIIISKSGYSSKTYDSLRIYPPLSTEIFIGSVANKTLDDLFDGGYDVAIKPSKIFGGASNTSGHTVPNAADDTFVLKDVTQTLTLKTLTSPVVNSPTINLVKAPSGTTNGHTIPTVADDTFALLAASQTFAAKTLDSTCALYLGAVAGKTVDDLFDGGYDVSIKPLTIITKSGPRLDATAWGATGDGATNDRAAIQNAIDNAGGRDVYLPAGTYLITPSGGLLFNFSSKNLRRFYGDGDKTIIKVVNSGNPNYGLYLDGGAAGLIFEGFKLDMNGANQASGNNYGFYVRNTSRIKIRDIWGINSRGTFVWITEPVSETTQDISVSNCIFDGTTLLAAVSVDSGRDIFIDGNIITNTGVVGIDIETAAGTTLQNVHVTNNKLRSCYAGIQNYGGNTSRGILISGNLIDTTTTGSGIRVYSSASKECVVSNNVVLKAFTQGIHLESAVGVSVMGNTVWNSGIQNSGTYGGITLDGATECLVAGNLCSDNQGTKTQDYGIYEIAPANNNLLVGNQLRNNGTGGILKVGSTTVRVGNLAGGGENTANLDMGTAIITDANVAYKTTATTSTPYAMTNEDTILMDATAGVKTVVPPVAPDTGRTVTIKKIDSSGNAVTVDPTASLTIDGALTYSLATQWKYVQIRYDGANWVVVSNN